MFSPLHVPGYLTPGQPYILDQLFTPLRVPGYLTPGTTYNQRKNASLQHVCRRHRSALYRYTHVVRDALSILPAPFGSGKAMGWRPPPPRPRSFASGRRAPRSRSSASGPRGDHQGLAAASPSWYRRAVKPNASRCAEVPWVCEALKTHCLPDGTRTEGDYEHW